MSTRVPELLAVGDRSLLGDRPFAEWVAELADAGVAALLVREKTSDDRALHDRATSARVAASGRLRVLVSGRPDVAVAAGADGVHLPADGLATAAVRRAFPELALVGRSTHSVAEVAAARRDGADYVTFGPVYATPAKRRFGAPQGLAALAAASREGLPVLAIGGIDATRVAAAADAGAAGVAAIRACHRSDDLRRLVDAVRQAWGSTPSSAARSRR